MTGLKEDSENARLVVGYFSDGADAYRAINELIDEGFSASEIGAAFRTRRGNVERLERPERGTVGEIRGIGERNPALTGSVGGPGSHDQAVTPAGLAPGAGAAFPAASKPGPIPGGEVPETLPHDLPVTLKHDLPSTLKPEESAPMAASGTFPATGVNCEARRTNEGSWSARLKNIFGGEDIETTGGPRLATNSSLKFGTGEGHLGVYPEYEYSEQAFEGSFMRLGLGADEARGLSGELNRGGAVVSVAAMNRASLAEAIVERNHGRICFETIQAGPDESDGDASVEVYGALRSCYRPEETLHRRAS